MFQAGCDLYEPNDNRATNPSGPLKSEETIQARLCANDGEDNYFFTTTTSKQIQITLNLPPKLLGHTLIWLYAADDLIQGNEICGSDNVAAPNYIKLCSIPKPGRYIVRLYTDAASDDLNPYTLRVKYE